MYYAKIWMELVPWTKVSSASVLWPWRKSSLKRFEGTGNPLWCHYLIISTGCLLWNKFVFITLYPILSRVVKTMENLQAPNKTSTRKDTCASESRAGCKEVPKLLGVQKILSWFQNPRLLSSTNHDRLYPQTVNGNTLFHLWVALVKYFLTETK